MPIRPTTQIARVYLGPEPERGPHPGYQGPIRLDARGVHIDSDCQVLEIRDEPVIWPDSAWALVETPCLIPWHRIDLIEWRDDLVPDPVTA